MLNYGWLRLKWDELRILGRVSWRRLDGLGVGVETLQIAQLDVPTVRHD